jgi:ketosteroid isomerase-like protein
MTPNSLSSETAHAVLQCQQHFWHALQCKDGDRFAQVLADDFVCRSPGQPDQSRTAFIMTLTSMPVTVISVTAEQVAVEHFDGVAVLTGTQVARLRLPSGSEVLERLALTNVFRQTAGQWQLVLAHPVTLHSH